LTARQSQRFSPKSIISMGEIFAAGLCDRKGGSPRRSITDSACVSSHSSVCHSSAMERNDQQMSVGHDVAVLRVSLGVMGIAHALLTLFLFCLPGTALFFSEHRLSIADTAKRAQRSWSFPCPDRKLWFLTDREQTFSRAEPG
jgi:hypothetical protein